MAKNNVDTDAPREHLFEVTDCDSTIILAAVAQRDMAEPLRCLNPVVYCQSRTVDQTSGIFVLRIAVSGSLTQPAATAIIAYSISLNRP